MVRDARKVEQVSLGGPGESRRSGPEPRSFLSAGRLSAAVECEKSPFSRNAVW
jgi:hypothetical protein